MKQIQPDAEGVIRSGVLSGLQFRLEDLRRRPRLAELARDEVYSEYVIPELQVAVIRVDFQEVPGGADKGGKVVWKAEEQAAQARADSETAARQQAEERMQALEAELPDRQNRL